jgi:hypothetical protein
MLEGEVLNETPEDMSLKVIVYEYALFDPDFEVSVISS